MRLIDADAFAEKIKEISIRQGYYDFYPESMSVGQILDSVIETLKGVGVCGFENAPTIDATPVVRCRDCRHYWKNGGDNSKGAVCLVSPSDDAFCSEGERRQE